MPSLTEIEQLVAQLAQQATALAQERASVAAGAQQLGVALSQRSRQLGTLQAQVAQVGQAIQNKNITPQ